MAYSEKVLDHYENPRNVGAFERDDDNVGTGMVGAPACGDCDGVQDACVDGACVCVPACEGKTCEDEDGCGLPAGMILGQELNGKHQLDASMRCAVSGVVISADAECVAFGFDGNRHQITVGGDVKEFRPVGPPARILTAANRDLPFLG